MRTWPSEIFPASVTPTQTERYAHDQSTPQANSRCSEAGGLTGKEPQKRDSYIQRRQEINDALQSLEGQSDSVKTESKDLLMQQKLELEGELPQHLGRIRAVAGHLRRALIDELNGEMTDAAVRVNSVINRLHVIRSTVGTNRFAQATIEDTVIPAPVDGRDLFKPPVHRDFNGHVIEADWKQDDSAVALHALLQPYHHIERCLEQLWFEQKEATRQGAGGLIPKPIR